MTTRITTGKGLGLSLLAIIACGASLAGYSDTIARRATSSIDAVPTLGDDALARVASTRHLVAAHLGRQIDLTQRTCGFAITLDRVYASSQHVVIGYTLHGPTGRRLNPGLGVGSTSHDATPTLTDGQGHHFSSIWHFFGSLSGNAEGRVLIFAPDKAIPRVRALTLHLVVPVIQVNEPNSARRVACETYTPANAIARTITVKGPLAFDFAVPVDSVYAHCDQFKTLLADGRGHVHDRMVHLCFAI